MPLNRGRTVLKSLCAFALLALVASGARAVEPAPADEGAITLDQTIQAVKDETVQFNRDALMAEEAFLFPPQTRLAIYVSNAAKNVLLSEISVTLDDKTPTVYRYGDKDSRALLFKGALQRLILDNVERGQHRVRVSYNGNYVSGDDEPEPVAGQFEAVFTKGLESAEIELALEKGRRKTEPVMKLKEWRAAEE